MMFTCVCTREGNDFTANNDNFILNILVLVVAEGYNKSEQCIWISDGETFGYKYTVVDKFIIISLGYVS